MPVRAWFLAGLLLAAVAGPAAAQEPGPRALARELARLVSEGGQQRGVDELVGTSMLQAMGASLEQRLNRRLLEVEWRMLARIIERFVAETLPASRVEAIAAEVYLRHFDEAELRALVEFQRSPVGRKAMRLAPVVTVETARALDQELRRSPAVPRMMEELRQAFPILEPREGP